jgi:protein gp37
MNNVKKSIGWCDWTINPVKGLCPVGCSYCYARRAYSRNCSEVFKDKTIRFDQTVFFDVGKSKLDDRIFVGSTIDLFHPLCSMWNDTIFHICANWKDRTFIFLTKCPENLPKEWPDNCWVGVSATNFQQAEKGMFQLRDIKAKVKFFSFEPLLATIVPPDTRWAIARQIINSVNWVIIGAQTPYSQKTAPKIEWVKEIVIAADKAGISVFLKNNLAPLIVGNKSFTEIDPIYVHKNGGFYTLRQERPEVLK